MDLFDEYYDIINEKKYAGVLANPVRKFVDTIEKIRKEKPASFDSDDTVKEFVDKHYGDIMNAAAIIEKEPEHLRSIDVRDAIGMALLLIGWCGTLIAPFTGVGGLILTIVAGILTFVTSIIVSVISYMRYNDDTKVSNDLVKIRSALKKLDTKKFSESHRAKIEKMIVAIDDAETEISTRVKIAKESVMNYNDIKLSIYESFDNGEIDEMEKDILLERLEERYNEEDNNEDITLEEAMDTISSYLSESTAQVRRGIELFNKRDDLELLYLKYKKSGDKEKCEKIRKEMDKITKQMEAIDPDNIAARAYGSGQLSAKLPHVLKLPGRPAMFPRSGCIADGKNISKSNKFRGNSKREPEVKGKYKNTNGLKESVDELRLDVYESYENGNITEEEKNMFLEYLNLDNYE